MSEKTAKPIVGRQVIAASSSLLAAAWIVALASIPSAQSYRDQLASGTAADYVPIRPELELAGACLLTGAYMVWIRIVRTLGS